MENELESYHNNTKIEIEQIFVCMPDFSIFLKLDFFSWRKTLQNSHNTVQRPVVNTLCQETKKHHNQKDWSKGTPKLDPCCELQLVVFKVNMEFESELCLWGETTLILGSEFPMDQIGLWWIWTTMKQKFQKFSSRRICVETECKGFLHADRRQETRKDFSTSSLRTIPIGKIISIDGCWTRRMFTSRLWQIEISDVFSPSWKPCTSSDHSSKNISSFLLSEPIDPC